MTVLIIAGSMTFNEADMADVRACMKEIVPLSRQDKGCVDYVWAEDVVLPNTMRFFECWESQADLDAHMGSPFLADFNDRVASKITDVTAQAYSAEAAG